MSRVLRPLFATAAARLIAVVVLPTPPFWLATVMIIGPSGILHLVLAHLVRVEILEPLFHLLVLIFAFGADGLGLIEDALSDEDRRLGAQGEGDGVARPGVDFERLSAHQHADLGEERGVAEIDAIA